MSKCASAKARRSEAAAQIRSLQIGKALLLQRLQIHLVEERPVARIAGALTRKVDRLAVLQQGHLAIGPDLGDWGAWVAVGVVDAQVKDDLALCWIGQVNQRGRGPASVSVEVGQHRKARLGGPAQAVVTMLNLEDLSRLALAPERRGETHQLITMRNLAGRVAAVKGLCPHEFGVDQRLPVDRPRPLRHPLARRVVAYGQIGNDPDAPAFGVEDLDRAGEPEVWNPVRERGLQGRDQQELAVGRGIGRGDQAGLADYTRSIFATLPSIYRSKKDRDAVLKKIQMLREQIKR